MSHRLPGRIFWTWTFAIGVISPTRGKDRTDRQVRQMEQELHTQRLKNDALRDDNRYLREELYRLQAENNLFQVQDEMNTAASSKAPRIRTTSWACPDMETTLSMPRPDPATTCPN